VIRGQTSSQRDLLQVAHSNSTLPFRAMLVQEVELTHSDWVGLLLVNNVAQTFSWHIFIDFRDCSNSLVPFDCSTYLHISTFSLGFAPIYTTLHSGATNSDMILLQNPSCRLRLETRILQLRIGYFC